MIEKAKKNREETLRILRSNLKALRESFGVRRLAVFGSVARGLADAESDVDILVEFERPIGIRFVDFADRLEALLGTRVDVLTPVGISSTRNPKIAKGIRESLIDVQPI